MRKGVLPSLVFFFFPCFLFCDPSQVVVTVVLAFFSVVVPPFLCAQQGPLFIALAVYSDNNDGREEDRIENL